MNLKSFSQSISFKKALCVIGAIIVAILIFQAGVFVGFKKANFSYKWGENYHRNFGGPRSGFMAPFMTDFMMGKDFLNSSGAFGKIIKIELPTMIIQGQNEAEKSVLIKEDTIIRRFNENIGSDNLKAGDQIVVIGEPNDKGQIEAKLIRVMPSTPPTGGPVK